MPQFRLYDQKRDFRYDFIIGLSIFAIGLVKKTVIADTMAQWATPVFSAATNGDTLSLIDSWAGAISYSFQIYFDFSGYSDMAIGLARMFGLKLPVNFHSPYKAVSIVDFWRRWHITLSRFLKDYLYIPLGGNRKGRLKRYRNLLVIMALGGIWHGAAWTFFAWGGVHGIFLIVNHVWAKVTPFNAKFFIPASLRNLMARSLTFAAITLAWVLFRADNFSAAANMYQAMFGYNV